MADPSAGLIFSSIKFVGKRVSQTWAAYVESKEMGELLRSALAWAICPEREQNEDVRELAEALEGRLRAVAVPRGKASLLTRVRRAPSKLVPRRLRPREVPEATLFGTSFQEHLEGWLRAALEGHDIAKDLVALDCAVAVPGAAGVVERFPWGFQVELYRPDDDASEFREDLANDLLAATRNRELMDELRSAAMRMLLPASQTVAPGGVGFTVAEIAGSGDTTAVAIGLGAATLGALAGRVTQARACDVAARAQLVRGMALAWIGELLGELGMQRTAPSPELLRQTLSGAFGDVVAGRLHWPPMLHAARHPRALLELAKDAQDTELVHALDTVNRRLEAAAGDAERRLPALGAMVDLVDLCAGGRDAR